MIMKYPVRMIMVVGALVLFLPLGLTALVSGREAVALQKKKQGNISPHDTL